MAHSLKLMLVVMMTLVRSLRSTRSECASLLATCPALPWAVSCSRALTRAESDHSGSYPVAVK